jgi:hypothetical protein
MTDSSKPWINIRSPTFFVARAVAVCGRCRSPIPVIAVAVPPGHETRDEDSWEIADHHALLFHIDYLPAAVSTRLQAQGAYRCDTHWINHCESCGAPQDDLELFCEPEGAFLPTSESSAALIEIRPVDEPFEAAAAGYAIEPQFLFPADNE